MNPDVIKKNFMALNQFMKDTRAEYHSLVTRIDGLQATISTQQAELVQLRQQNGLLQATLMGRGPTA